MTCAALITAGGIGARMRAGTPKQFLELDGVPILALSIKAFQVHPLIDRIVVTCPSGYEDKVWSVIVQPYGLDKVATIALGGETRQESVYKGLLQLEPSGIVAIHDGVRPFVSQEAITATIEAARLSGASVACSPVNETVKRQKGAYLETIPRKDLWLAHTPQTFRMELILEAHRKALREAFQGTDDASLVERLGRPVTVVEDKPYNLKITTPDDLKPARMILRELEGKAQE